MLQCRHCGEVFAGSEDSIGARCRRCREPLYERPETHRPRPTPVEGESGKPCAIHPRTTAVGNCQRCNNAFCRVCRTRWNELAYCVACVEQSLGSNEPSPREVRAQRRQAVLGLVCGVTAWLFVVLACVFSLFRASGHKTDYLVLTSLLLLCGLLPSLVGVGQGAAAVRSPSNRPRVALCGLILSGAHVGVLLGLALLLAWHS
jgi:hypothetical protein